MFAGSAVISAVDAVTRPLSGCRGSHNVGLSAPCNPEHAIAGGLDVEDESAGEPARVDGLHDPLSRFFLSSLPARMAQSTHLLMTNDGLASIAVPQSWQTSLGRGSWPPSWPSVAAWDIEST